MEYVDSLEDYESLYVTAYTGYGANTKNSEILMNYAVKHDAMYMQGKSNISNDKEYIPYKERYHFFYLWDENEADLAAKERYKGYRVCFLVHENELENIDMPYVIVEEINEFKVIEWTENDED